MTYVVPANTPAYVQPLGNPWSQWRKWRTTRLQRFDRPHEVHDEHYVFLRDGWKLAAGKRLVWRARAELEFGRNGRLIFLAQGDGQPDVIHLTNDQGRLIDTLRDGDSDYAKYLRLLQNGGGKDPYEIRT